MSESGTFEDELDLAWLLKVRTVVARRRDGPCSLVELNRTAWSARLIGSAPRISQNASLRPGPIGIHGRRRPVRANLRPSWFGDALASDRSHRRAARNSVGRMARR